MKAKRRYPKLGDKVLVNYCRCSHGKWWWLSSWNNLGCHGPFLTESEAHRHSQMTIMGPQCEVKYGGQWDPAWDKEQ
jgi:hypothetical protein